MNFCILLSIVLIILLFLHIFSGPLTEGYRGRRRRHGRRWYGPRWGYRYRPPPGRRWRGGWAGPFWGSVPFWGAGPFWGPSTSVFCPTGCSNLGRGRWGCTNPGYGSGDCWFASDCAPCGY